MTFTFCIAQVATLREDASGVSKQPTSVVEVSESKIDQVMSMLNEADPTLPESDPSGMRASNMWKQQQLPPPPGPEYNNFWSINIR